MRDYKKIDAWKFADDMTVEAYQLTKSFPNEEKYGLVNQLRRAAYSVPSNIAEGASRSSKRDYLHFLYMARGSASEVEYFIHLSRRLQYIKDDEAKKMDEQVSKTQSCLFGLIKAVEKEAGPLRKTIAKSSSFLFLTASALLAKASL